MPESRFCIQKRSLSWGSSGFETYLITNQVPFLSKIIENGVTVERVRQVLPKEELLITNARKGSKLIRKQKSKYKNAVIVMGHTHELDTSEKYANLGTWIDHLSGLTLNHVGHPESSLPVLKIDETGKAILYTIHGSEKVKLVE